MPPTHPTRPTAPPRPSGTSSVAVPSTHLNITPCNHHVYLTTLDLKSPDSEATISFQNHSPADLVHALRFMNKNLNSQQQTAKMIIETYESHGRIRQLHSSEDLQKYFRSFDDLFFRGHLGMFCEIQLEECSKLLGNDYVLGYTKPILHPVESDKMILIVVARPAPVDGPDLTQEERKIMLATLLHEMAHAYFLYYSCINSDHTECVDMFREQVGTRLGHRNAWQDVALILRKSAETVLGGEWDLGQSSSIALEWAYKDMESGLAWNDPGEAAFRWEVNPKSVCTCIEEICDSNFNLEFLATECPKS